MAAIGRRKQDRAYAIATMCGWARTDPIIWPISVNYDAIRKTAEAVDNAVKADALVEFTGRFSSRIKSWLSSRLGSGTLSMRAASFQMWVQLQSVTRFASLVGRDITTYFEALKADAVISCAMEQMSPSHPEDLTKQLADKLPSGYRIPSVDQVTVLLKNIYDAASQHTL